MKKSDAKLTENPEELDKKTVELTAQAEEWKTKYLRALADYQNLDKRSREQIGETQKFAIIVFVERLLSVLDTLEQAQTHLKDQGLVLALKEMDAVFAEYGIVKIKTIGKEFNPHEMECIEVVSGKDNIVAEETQTGYKMHDKVIRVAKVKVGKNIINAVN